MQNQLTIYHNNILNHVRQNLNSNQWLQFKKTIQQFQPHPNIIIDALKLYFDSYAYFSTQVNYLIRLPSIVSCVFILAEINNYLKDNQNHQINFLSIFINQLIKASQNYQTQCRLMLPLTLKFYAQTTIEDNKISLAISNFAQSMYLWIQYDQIMHKVQNQFSFFSDQQFSYKQHLLSFSWLLFIDSYLQLQLPIQQNYYLMAAVVYCVVRYSITNIDANSFMSENNFNDNVISLNNFQIDRKKSIISTILEKVLYIFQIKNIPTFKKISDLFDNHFNQLLQNQIIKCKDGLDFLSPKLINLNYRRLDCKFIKELPKIEMDYRLFLKQRVLNLSPDKLIHHYRFNRTKKNKKLQTKTNLLKNISEKQNKTFEEQNKLPKKSELKSKINNHRILNFKQQSPILLAQQTHSFQDLYYSPSSINCLIPTNVLKSPIIFKHKLPLLKMHQSQQLINQKQIIVLEQIYEYFHRIKAKQPTSNTHILQLIIKNIDNVFNVQQLAQFIYQIYFSIAQQFFQETDYQETQLLHKSLLTYVFYLMVENNQLFLDQVCQNFEACVLDLLIVGNFLQHFDNTMPEKIVYHIKNINQQLLEFYVWNDSSLTQQIKQSCVVHKSDTKNNSNNLKYQNRNQQSQKTISQIQKIQYLLMQTLSYVQNLSQCISKIIFKSSIQLSEKIVKIHQQVVCEQVLLCMKYWMISANMLNGKYLSQIFMCTYYLICKINLYEVKFNDIKNAYQQIKNPQQTAYLTQQVAVNGTTLNIIEFYNQYFLIFVKPCLQFMINPSLSQQPQILRQSDFCVQENRDNFKSFSASQNFQEKPYAESQKQCINIPNFLQRCQTRIKSRPIQQLFQGLSESTTKQ